MHDNDPLGNLKVWAVNGATLGAVTFFENAERSLKLLLLVASLAYTCYKIFLAHKHERARDAHKTKDETP